MGVAEPRDIERMVITGVMRFWANDRPAHSARPFAEPAVAQADGDHCARVRFAPPVGVISPLPALIPPRVVLPFFGSCAHFLLRWWAAFLRFRPARLARSVQLVIAGSHVGSVGFAESLSSPLLVVQVPLAVDPPKYRRLTDGRAFVGPTMRPLFVDGSVGAKALPAVVGQAIRLIPVLAERFLGFRRVAPTASFHACMMARIGNR